MIVVTVELHSAITHQKTVLGRMIVANDGTGTVTHGDYDVYVGRPGDRPPVEVYKNPLHRTKVTGHSRRKGVWTLVKAALDSIKEW